MGRWETKKTVKISESKALLGTEPILREVYKGGTKRDADDQIS